MKPQLRVLGLDDAPFNLDDKEVMVVATFYRGGAWMDGVLSTKVEVDGEDATIKLIEMINKSKFKPQLQALLLDGIAVGGFNVINIHSLNKHTGIPVIVVVRKRPDFEKLEKTLQKLGMEKKYALMERAGKPEEVKIQDKVRKEKGRPRENSNQREKGSIFIQTAGISIENAKKLLKICCTRSYIPEPIRAAHLIGAGIVKGESKGRA